LNLANKITIARIMLVPVFVVVFSMNIYAAAAVFLLASATDKLDGYVARKYNQITNLGKLLDPLADKLLIAAALILMVNEHLIGAWIAAIIIGREFVITGIRIVASSQGIALQADQFGKIKMVFQVIAITAVLLDNFPFSFLTDLPVDQALMVIALGLTIYSGYNYIRNNYRRLHLDL
jgi:CDP-diacylglycerol---glycerol-3-phosphate 3-phosphatidyltransferase